MRNAKDISHLVDIYPPKWKENQENKNVETPILRLTFKERLDNLVEKLELTRDSLTKIWC
jgi:hypothetical protein